MTAYITTQGARIVREGRHLLVKKGDDTYATLFTYKLDQILLFGNINVTHSAMVQLMRDGIDIVFLTKSGRYLGRIEPPESKNVFLRKRQFLMQDDPVFVLGMAKSLAAGKMNNMAALLMRIKRTRKTPEAGVLARNIMDLAPKLARAESVEAVLGFEGRASALYFKGFRHGFVQDQGFAKRVRRPPTDPVNAVLSLVYTFVLNRVYAAVRRAGLDPYPGSLHFLEYGRHSLVLDLMEEFRTIIADTLVLSLFNLNMLQNDDFVRIAPLPQKMADDSPKPDVSLDPMGGISGPEPGAKCFDMPEQSMENDQAMSPPTGKQPVKLTPPAFKAVIESFEKKLTTRFHHPQAEREISYNEAMTVQAGLYRKVIEGEAETYMPLALK